jgi:hypothetical protein
MKPRTLKITHDAAREAYAFLTYAVTKARETNNTVAVAALTVIGIALIAGDTIEVVLGEPQR